MSPHFQPVAQPVAKIFGADFEFGQAFATASGSQGHADDAALKLLAQIAGYPRTSGWGGTAIERGRRFLKNGGSAYIDSSHLEINLAEHGDALQHAAILHGGLRIARRAQQAVERQLRPGIKLNVFANCTDGLQAYGSHFNVLVSRRTFGDIMQFKPHLAAFLATFLVTSVPFTGQGLVGAANGRPACEFQFSQRGDFIETFASLDTMHTRPLINTRDESHAAADLARLHIIFFDMVLSPTANLLKAGATQLVLAMIEQGYIEPGLLLDDPVGALAEISRDLDLQQRLPLAARGRRMTALEIQRGYCDLAGEFVSAGLAAKIVPHADEIVHVWSETLDWLARKDREALARFSDAWQKYLLLDRYRGRRNLSWQSPELRVADLFFSSTDPDDSLFFKMAADGQVENMPDDATIERFADEPPDDTRAWLRAHLLRQYGEDVSSMDWGWIRFRIPRRSWYSVAEVTLDDPRRFGRDECAGLLADAPSLEEVVNRLAEAPVPLQVPAPLQAPVPLQEIPPWNANAPHTNHPRHLEAGGPNQSAIPWTAPAND